MALETSHSPRLSAANLDYNRDGAMSNDLYDDDAGRSNFSAFLLGGMVIAGGLLGFLYYDTDNLSQRDGLTTGSIGQISAPAPVPVLRSPADANTAETPPAR